MTCHCRLPGPVSFVTPPNNVHNAHNDHDDDNNDNHISSSPHILLYCFPHAGGSPTSFREWPSWLMVNAKRQKVQLRVLSLPGRGSRWKEPVWDQWTYHENSCCGDCDNGNDTGNDKQTPCHNNEKSEEKKQETTTTSATTSIKQETTLDDLKQTKEHCLVAATTQAFLDDWDGLTPFCFFGHSFGTLLVYEVIHRLKQLNLPLPVMALLSAHRAPGLSWHSTTSRSNQEEDDLPEIAQQSTDQFVDMVRHWGLVPEESWQDVELRQIMLPALKADLQLDQTHLNILQARSEPLPVPLVLYGGLRDETVSRDELQAWRTLAPTTTTTAVAGWEEVWFPEGGHFYTVTHFEELMRDVTARLTTSLTTLVEPSILMGPNTFLVQNKAEETLPDSSIMEMFWTQTRQTPHLPAVVDERNVTWSYEELGRAVQTLGEYWISSNVNTANIKEPPRLGIYLHHSSMYLLAHLSAWYAGYSVVLLERNWTDHMLLEFVTLCDIQIIATDDQGMEELASANLVHHENVTCIEPEHMGVDPKSVENRTAPHVVVFPSENLFQLGQLRLDSSSTCRGPIARGMEDVAFVSMTSGSTGKPSAVLTTYKGVKFCFEARYDLYPYRNCCTKESRAQEKEGVNVFFAWEALRPILRGQTLIIIPDQVILSPPDLITFLHKSGISRLVVTPSLLESIFSYPHLGSTLYKQLAGMYGIFLMGEVVQPRLIERASAFLPNHVKLVNAYSSWEALDVSYSDLLPMNQCQSFVNKTLPYAPVGFPLSGVCAILLDEYGQPVPRGVPGALHILSPAVALGYLGDPDKTKRRFRPLPSNLCTNISQALKALNGKEATKKDFEGHILFNSGDVGRILPDGQLGLEGRKDDTVKLRGYKVGIPFVETTLASIENVASVVVTVVYKESSRRPDFLVAYIVGTDGKPTNEAMSKIAKIARSLLPPFAVPLDFVGLNALPLRKGESRKIDRNALPEPPSLIERRARNEPKQGEKEKGGLIGIEKDVRNRHFRSRLELVLFKTWTEVLRIDESAAKTFNPRDNFFDLGGNSLLASELIGRLASVYGLPISVLDLYEHSSFSALVTFCQRLSTKGKEVSSAVQTSQRSKRFRSPSKYSGKLAIIGMSGKFPGAENLNEFWKNLQEGNDSLRHFSKAELASHGLDPEVYNDPDWIAAGQCIGDADKFDAAFWGISPREARIMDPQHRVFLEVAWSALEDAGYPPQSSSDRQRTGVWASCGIDGYLVHHLKGGGMKTPLDPSHLLLTEVGNEKDYISTRVSYAMDLGGPSINVNSACSSGLVAVSQAAQSLMIGQTDVAIAGASSISFPNFGYCYQEGLVGSKDGRVRPFDEEASGTVFGDAVGALVLKRLEDAIEDGDHIWSLLTGFDVSNDGMQKAGYSAPSASAQSRCIVGAMDMARVTSEQISYVECHATATHVGDAIELRGLTDAFQATASCDNPQYQTQQCAIGSVKGNTGHANCAAGIVGIMKTALSLKNRVLVPTVNYNKASSKLAEFLSPKSSFFINTDLKEWQVANADIQLPRRAGVSSFGIGGTNVHVILEEYGSNAVRNDIVQEPKETGACILPLSAKTPTSLAHAVKKLAHFLAANSETESPIPLHDIAFTLQCGREAFMHRAAIVAKSHLEASRALETLEKRMKSNKLDDASLIQNVSTDVVMFFPGQGSHYKGMARALYRDVSGPSNLFRKHFERTCRIFDNLLNFDMLEAFFSDDDETFDSPTVSQPSIFAVEYALARALIDLKVKPIAVAGHSIGEYVAATVSGILNVEDAALLVAERAKSISRLATGNGAMLSVQSSPDILAQILDKYPSLSLAADNGPNLVVISGDSATIDDFARELKSRDILHRRLKVSHAFHSEQMRPVADHLVAVAKSIQVSAPRIPLTSNVTGRWVSSGADNVMFDPEYWGNHVVGTVKWRENVGCVLKWQPSVVVEVGPGNTLVSLFAKCLEATNQHSNLQTAILTSLPHAQDSVRDDGMAIAKLLANLWEAGVEIDWKQNNQHHQSHRVSLPTYSFEKTSYWVNPEASIYVPTNVQADVSTFQVVWKQVGKLSSSEEENSVAREDVAMLHVEGDDLEVTQEIIEAIKSPAGLVLVISCPRHGFTEDTSSEFQPSLEIDLGWKFIKFAQDVVSCTNKGTIHMVCPASRVGSLAVGASRSIEQEYSNLRFARSFLPLQHPIFDSLNKSPNSAAPLLKIRDLYKTESDLLFPEGFKADGRVLAQKLDRTPLHIMSSPQPVFGMENEESGVYLVTGGRGALGQALIQHLIQKHRVPESQIILLSRTPDSLPNFPSVRTIQVDFNDRKRLADNTGLRSITDVRGIFHLAGALDDAILVNQTRERLENVVAPKAGICALLTVGKDHGWKPRFVMAFSSTTSLLGYAGQSNYGAANALLDQMASSWESESISSLRRSSSKSTALVTVNWGSWGQVGMAAEGTKAYETALKLGDLPMRTDSALGALDALFDRLLSERKDESPISGQYCICGMKWEASPWRDNPLVRNLISQSSKQVRATNPPKLDVATGGSRENVEDLLKNHISRWQTQETLVALGLDSLDLVQLVRDVSKKLGVEMAMQDILTADLTLAGLTDHLVALVDGLENKLHYESST